MLRRWSDPSGRRPLTVRSHVLACLYPHSRVARPGSEQPGTEGRMASRRSRESAYADLVAGLLDVRTDLATDRFDAELSAAEDDGRIDPQTAKVLRWWQRETLRALVEHARVVVPPTLLALEQSAAGAGQEVEESAQSW